MRVVYLALLAAVAGCSGDTLPLEELTGAAMGTTFSVKVVSMPADVDRDELEVALRQRLETTEQALSTYRPDSELSVFNAEQTTDWVTVSAELCDIVAAALAISASTDGAFDVTVGPLVNLWGFGPADARSAPPTDDAIALGVAASGYDKLEADCAVPALRKAVPGLYVDLSAYAKGRAVDELAAMLEERGIDNYLVELGGELRLNGINAAGRDWAIAIETPEHGGRSVQSIADLSGVGMATSGDYRNYFEHEGRLYSHTIDPRTGRPVGHATASVTVIAASTGFADAMATALLVMGADAGLEYAETHDIAAYFLLRTADGVEERRSERFRTEVALR